MRPHLAIIPPSSTFHLRLSCSQKIGHLLCGDLYNNISCALASHVDRSAHCLIYHSLQEKPPQKYTPWLNTIIHKPTPLRRNRRFTSMVAAINSLPPTQLLLHQQTSRPLLHVPRWIPTTLSPQSSFDHRNPQCTSRRYCDLRKDRTDNLL